MKKNLFFGAMLLVFLFSSCNYSKKELSNALIQSYALAVNESDVQSMKEVFPDIVYFKEYPKTDKIELIDMEVEGDVVFALCSLYYKTGMGKEVNKELKFKINTSDSIIVNVRGYLTRKERNNLKEAPTFDIFPELRPHDDDMDLEFLKNQSIAVNRIDGFEYYAKKAIGDRTKIDFKLSHVNFKKYGIINYYRNVRLKFQIKNNSYTTSKYLYKDDNYEYDYAFDEFISDKDIYSANGGVFVVSGQKSVALNYAFKYDYTTVFSSDKIEIIPIIESTQEAIKIVKLYFEDDVVRMLNNGNKSYWKENRDYKIPINLKLN